MKINNQPYPKSDSIPEIIISSAFAGIIVYLFLIVFQPFGTDNFTHRYKYFILFPYTLIIFFTFLIGDLIVIRLKNWTVNKEIFKVFLILSASSVFCYFYNTFFISKVLLSIENFLYMFLYTLAIGVPVSVIYILARFIYLKSKHTEKADKISTQLEKHSSYHEFQKKDSKILKITPHNKFQELLIQEEDFLFAISADNYCEIYFLKENLLKKELLRLSFTQLVLQIETDYIKRCHRSYMVNLRKVSSVKGNAQGYKLRIENTDFDVPVSRNYISSIIPVLENS